MKKLTAVLLVCAVISVGAYYLFRKSDKGPRFTTAPVTRGLVRAVCTASGTVNPLTTVQVGTQVSGRIKDLYADYNSPVAKGQLIAELDPAIFHAQCEQARANLLAARASLAKARASLRDAERTRGRIKKLFDSGIAGQSELDTAETGFDIAQSQVSVASAQVVQTQAAFAYAETNLRYTKIFSPVDGIVISRNVDVGQTVAATFQTPTLFTIAQDLKKMQINASIDEADIGQISVGQTAEFTVDAYPELVFKGIIEQIRNAPVVVQNVVTYDVVIIVDNPQLKLRPGMTANVTVLVAVREDVLRIPNAALRFVPEQQPGEVLPGRRCVWIAADSEARCVEIETGIQDPLYTELLAGDLTEDAQVIIAFAGKNSH